MNILQTPKRCFQASLTLMLTLLFAACGRQAEPYPRELVVADSLCETDPRVAAMLLDSIGKDTAAMSVAARMYYRLLLIRAADKNFVTHTSDSAILPVLNYYQGGGDSRLLPVAYYYAGRVARDMNDYLRALDYFLEAAERLTDESRMSMKGRAYSQIGNLFFFQQLFRQELAYHKKATACFVKDNNEKSLVYNYNDIACAYYNNSQTDSATAYFNKALNLAKKLEDPHLVSFTNICLAAFYKEEGRYEDMHRSLLNVTDIRNDFSRSAYYSMCAEYYKHQGTTDSVLYYCERLQQMGTLYAQKEAASLLMKIYQRLQENDSISKYAEIYRLCTDSVQKITRTATVSHSESQYKDKKIESLKDTISYQKHSFLFCLMTMLLAFAVVGRIIYKKRMKREEQLPTVNGQKDDVAAERMNAKDLAWHITNGPSHLSPSDWEKIEADFDKLYPQFRKKLAAEVKRISTKDMNICILLKLGLTAHQIADLECLSVEGIYTSCRRMHKKAGHEEAGYKEWVKHIENIQ